MHGSNSTVILLLNRRSGEYGTIVKNWLEKSRFLSHEAIDIFQAIETISDFTGTYRPEVVLLEVESISEELSMLQQIAACTSGETQIPFMAVSDTNCKFGPVKNYYFGNLKQVEIMLDRIFPEHFQYQAAA